MSEDNGIVETVRRFQPSLIPYYDQSEYRIDNPDTDKVRIFYSSFKLEGRDYIMEKNDDDNSLVFYLNDEEIFSISLQSVTVIGSLTFLFITNSEYKLLLYTPYSSLFSTIIKNLSGNESPYITDVEVSVRIKYSHIFQSVTKNSRIEKKQDIFQIK